jgi:hypothetical protein
MSSELKLTNLKHPSSGSNNLVLASDGNVSITNTLSAGTIGSSVVFPTGHVLQTVAMEYSTETSVTSSSFEVIHSSFKVDITPATSSNKILVMFTNPVYSNTSSVTMGVTIFRSISGGASNENIGATNWGFGAIVSNAGALTNTASAIHLDSPNTDQQVTYQIAHKIASATGYSCINSSKASIVAMEIKV